MTTAAHWIETLQPEDARTALVQALELEGGSAQRAADRLGLTRVGLWAMLRDLGMLSIPAQVISRRDIHRPISAA